MFTIKQIPGAVVKKLDHSQLCSSDDPDIDGCNCGALYANRGIDAQSSVKLRLNREKLGRAIFHSFYDTPDWSTVGSEVQARYLKTADAIIAADKDIVEVAS